MQQSNTSPPLFVAADIMIPRGRHDRWAVIACDQYTSDPGYWEAVRAQATGYPSAIDIILPESELETPDIEVRYARIAGNMRRFADNGVFDTYPNAMIGLERTLPGGVIRRGIVGAVDLEHYDYTAGSASPIRATEGTILERIPPRVKIREQAVLEIPHIMLLIDDPDCTVIEPAVGGQPVYDFDLMQGGGHVGGRLLPAAEQQRITDALSRLPGTLRIAVGDGNHSLATAKECYERVKARIGAAAALSHPSRYALAELGNLHDPALVFEPIHRVVTDTDAAALLAELRRIGGSGEPVHFIRYITADSEGSLPLTQASNLPVGTLQIHLDRAVKNIGGVIDYIHGDETARELGGRAGNVAFVLPAMPKCDLFPTVVADGALPRKTFSMGHADDKRFYLECRMIV